MPRGSCATCARSGAAVAHISKRETASAPFKNVLMLPPLSKVSLRIRLRERRLFDRQAGIGTVGVVRDLAAHLFAEVFDREAQAAALDLHLVRESDGCPAGF